jgi:outer membrane protein insertion porin family
VWRSSLFLFVFLAAFVVPAFGDEGAIIVSLDVEGVEKTVPSYVLGAVSSKAGEPVSPDKLDRDRDAVYDLGFYETVDYRVEDVQGGARVVFQVKENPVVQALKFKGNVAYREEELKALCFTSPGNIFNRTFFRNDLQRITDKYRKDGYVMMRVQDVEVKDGVVEVTILEPRVGEVVIQGNKKTKDYVIRRELKIAKGDLFNATVLRHSLNRLQAKGYFEDVSVGFEPTDDPGVMDLIITVEEAKTGKLGLSIGHGSQSGWSGGLSFQDSNWQGLGTNLSVGFELGDNEQYWGYYTQPYMDQDTYSWRLGVYKKKWTDYDYYKDNVWKFTYDQEKTGAYVGAGKKFRGNDQLSWFVTLDWHKVDNVITSGDATDEEKKELEDGTNASITASITRNTLDPYLSYPKGDVETLNFEKGLRGLGGDWDYTKYWLEARYYAPLFKLMEYLDFGSKGEDNPLLLALRAKAGWGEGDVPWGEMYVVGGANSLRGYKDNYFRGEEMFLLNAEIRIPMDDNISLVFFYDTGKAWKKSENQGMDLSDLSSSKGIGIRVKTPLGNMRLDFAQGDDESRTHFGFGDMF